jgi:beta-glucosidase
MASMKYEAVDAPPPAKPEPAAAAASSSSGSWVSRHLPFLKTKRGVVITVIVVLVIIGGGLAGLAALPKKNGDGANGSSGLAADAITSDTYFYGQSPPVYPSRTYRHMPATLMDSTLSLWL